MRVGILGAGAIGFGMAAFLNDAGHRPTIWSPSGQRTRTLAGGAPLVATGAIETSFVPRVAADAAEAVADQDVVLLALPGNGHKMAMDAIAPHLQAGQIVVISSHASFGALYLSRLLARRGVSVPIVAWGTTLTTGRQTSDTQVNVNTVRQRIDLATVPAASIDAGHAICTELFGDRFVRRDGLLAIALSNLNPQNHMGIALCNLTRMERGEKWGQGENVTPAVGRLLEALDAERLAVAEAFGVQVRTIFEHFSLSFHVPMASVSAMNQEMHAAGRGGIGPDTLESRYVLEDVPFGLVPTARLASLAGVPARLHESGIAIFGAAYGRDFAGENDLLPAVGLDGLGPEDLKRLATAGYTPDTAV
ncbi:NAD/NADP octopine/nopaline dehydrogenase family protein [Fodinicurvata sp. EGI_FJ10296]|uniref:NAD/NADP octopine/nopaline dehydrogenase family protein n=1 Tax=Fodinicurvata sp. EGI_FJ10296 TaxID=3231908 RepID=UPI003456014C